MLLHFLCDIVLLRKKQIKVINVCTSWYNIAQSYRILVEILLSWFRGGW